MDYFHIYNFVGSKGGVGTTLAATTFALYLHEQNFNVAILHGQPNYADDISLILNTNRLSESTRMSNPKNNLWISNDFPSNQSFSLDTFLHKWPKLHDLDYVIIDWGTNAVVRDGHQVIVLENNYLSLRNYLDATLNIGDENFSTQFWCTFNPANALTKQDVTALCGKTIFVDVDPLINRAVDAGLFESRMPAPLRQKAEDLYIGSFEDAKAN